MDVIDFGTVLYSVFDFIKLLVLLVIVSFVLYKIFSPARKWLEERFNLSWLKSTFVLNFIIIFLGFLAVYIGFLIIGALTAPPSDPDIAFDFFDNVVMVLFAAGRILLIALILSCVAMFFEMIASIAMPAPKKSSRAKAKEATLVGQVIGITISSAIFLVLFLFAFNWVPLGVFVFVFYGSLAPLLLLIPLL